MDSKKDQIISDCKKILKAYIEGKLGYMKMPEDENPGFTESQIEERLSYFTLPMALNYQRNSYTLRESAIKTYLDPETQDIFDISKIKETTKEELKAKLLKYKLALQPNKHIDTRYAISNTIYDNRGSITKMLISINYDFLKLKYIFEKEHKKGLPYISGPKIFNYRSCVLQTYCNIKFENAEFIEIALDTHVSKASVRLGVITQQESEALSKEEVYNIRRNLLKGSGINPSDMHSPLRFRSRNNFEFQL